MIKSDVQEDIRQYFVFLYIHLVVTKDNCDILLQWVCVSTVFDSAARWSTDGFHIPVASLI